MVTDEPSLRRLVQRWGAEVKPGAEGVLGATAGGSADGAALVFVRFADEASAEANRRRSEQAAWWQDMLETFEASPAVHESSDTALLLAGGSDDAGFVQVVRAPTPDRAKIDALMTPERIAEVE